MSVDKEFSQWWAYQTCGWRCEAAQYDMARTWASMAWEAARTCRDCKGTGLKPERQHYPWGGADDTYVFCHCHEGKAEEARQYDVCYAKAVPPAEHLKAVGEYMRAAELDLEERNQGADIAADKLREIAETGLHVGAFGGQKMEAAARAILALHGRLTEQRNREQPKE